MQIIDYIKPELLIVSVVLYFFDRAIKQSTIFEDKYIPLINGVAGIFICGIYVVSASQVVTKQQLGMAAFTAITQGMLVSGISTYAVSLINSEGKIDFKSGLTRSGSSNHEIKTDVMKSIKREMKREIKKDIENDIDEETGCDMKCDIKREIKSNIKNEIILEIENELINQIEDELIDEMKKKSDPD